ncbi:PRP24 [Sanghuangporus weigelae]
MDESQSLEALSNILTQINENPFDLSLYAQYLNLALSSGVDDQDIMPVRQMLTMCWPAGDDVWLSMIGARIREGIDSLEDTMEVLNLFQTAEDDYFSLTLLQKHIEFLIDRHAHFSSSHVKSEEPEGPFSREWTRTMLESVFSKGSSHLTKGHLLWNPYLNWMMEQLENPNLQGAERTDFIVQVDDAILARLQQPHSTREETFQTYSTFTTNFKPANIYEKNLVEASKLKARAVRGYERREQLEQYLEQSGYSLEAYNYYLTYERRAKKIDLPVISCLYERAISDTARRRFNGENNAEAALRIFWLGYCDVLRMNNEDIDRQRAVLQRAVRSVPGSGAIWASYMRFLESAENDSNILLQSVAEIYNKAFSTGLLQKDIEDIVPVVLARAGLIKRTIMGNDEVEDSVQLLFDVLSEGIARVRQASRQGDPRFRLEKFLAELYVNLAEAQDLAGTVWEAAAKHSKSSYLAWTQYIESLTKQGRYGDARAVFKEIVNKRLDWPEAIFDAWIGFEHLYGTVQEIYECLDQVERAQNQVSTRRAKEAEKAAPQATQNLGQPEAASTLISEVVQQASEGAKASHSVSTMEVDDASGNVTRKRKTEASDDKSEGSKKAKTVATSAPPKRDRENSTVFIGDLPSDVSETDLSALFKDCGAIREVKISTVANSHVATVEFQDRESVPAALTKDKKRLRDQEISVHVAWKSTLYVTNFPEKVDDAYIRELFGQFGHIFDVRWPSKKFKATRRFCYVQFTSTEAAQAALLLHGKELEPGLTMNVYVSDPERKKGRTDAGANDREVYVAGLSKFVTEKDLEKLFKTYGPIKEIRVIKDDAGLCKGVAFVEFEDETSAQRSLQANNHDMKNRRIAVTLSDSRVRARHKNEQTSSGLGRRDDVLSRSVRIKSLPPDAQEGLLQQTIEKVVLVKRLEIFQDVREATAELESAADAGKLLLMKSPLQFGGSNLEITEELPGPGAKRQPQPKAGSSAFIPRNAAARHRAGFGSLKKPRQNPVDAGALGNGQQGSVLKSGKSQDDFRKLLR